MTELKGASISQILDFSYGNLRLVLQRKDYTETVVISREELLQLLQSVNYYEACEPRHSYTHLMPIIEE